MKKFKNNFIILFFLYIILQLFFYINEIKTVVFLSYKLFIYNILPNIFPFLVISKLLINYGFIDLITNILKRILIKFFKIDPVCSYIFVMSLLTGFPSSAKYTKDLYDLGYIGSKTASKILLFTHFSNPLFIIGTISFFINYKTAFIILVAHYIGNIIIGLVFRNSETEKTNKIFEGKQDSFGVSLSNGIKDSINTLLLIFGTMTFFLIVSNSIFNSFHLNVYLRAILSGILELTQGIKYVSVLNVSIKIKAIMMGFFISFGGLSVHAQVFSIISNTDISYKKYLGARIIHAFVTSFIIYLLI